jgi:hypothetical protein
MKLATLDQSFGEILRAEFSLIAAPGDVSSWRDRLLRIERMDDGRLEAHGSGGQGAIVVPEGRKADRFIDRIVDGGADALVWAVDASQTHLVVQGHVLRDVRPIPQGLVVGLGAAAPELKVFLDAEGLATSVGEELVLAQGDGERLGVLVALPARPEEDRFEIHGPRYRLEVRHRSGQPVVVRLIKSVKKRPALSWLAGPVRFVDGTEAAVADEATRAQLLAIPREGTYLGRWRKYNDIERRLVVERAAARGVARYLGSPVIETRGEHKLLVFQLAEEPPPSLAELAEQADVHLGVLDREGIEAFGMSAQHYFKHWELPKEERDAVAPARARLLAGHGLGRPVLLPGDECALAVEVKGIVSAQDIPIDGWLTIDLRGETVRLDRREQAMRILEEHQSRLARLHDLVEGRGPGRGVARMRRVTKAVTRGVQEAMGEAEINESQRNAILAALRTPDVALILGPPGTGKTAVIRAIVRLLGELDRDLGVRTHVLLSAFQHDAVDEVMKDVTLCGMSGFRVGGPSGEGVGSAEELRLAQAEKWAAPRIERALREAAKLPEEPIARAWRLAEERFVAWRADSGGSDCTRAAIAEIEDLLRPYLDGEVADALAKAWSRQQQEPPRPRSLGLDSADEARLVERLAGLRTSREAFIDDGPRQARRLLDFCEAAGVELDDTARGTIEEASVVMPGRLPEDDLLQRLQACQQEIRRTVQGGHAGLRVPAPDPQAEAAMRTALNQAARRVVRSAEGARRALEEFARALRADLPGLASTMERYAQALGATNQQSVRAGVERDYELADHDMVIVDEAARANPLDLLIPLVRGERIILVGDPNQLPHVLESRVEEELEQDGNQEAKKILGESLFERLWRLCEQWTAADGIPRAVQLNEQYRMHPELGTFVSRNFYERRERDAPLDKTKEVRNGKVIDPRLHEHRFPSFEGRVGAWIDVPWHLGREEQERGSRSRVRPVEIDLVWRLVELVRREDPSASIGVITFYKDQALRIARRLGVGLGEGDALRVGTVDAFQGRQFDTVILSTVRANDIRGTDDEARTSRIGFLALPNRLCVAMSRARKLLVVVGCKETTAGIAPTDASPRSAAPDSACWQLARFYNDVCGGVPFQLPKGAR